MCVLRRAQKYCSYTMTANIVIGRKRAVPGVNPEIPQVGSTLLRFSSDICIQAINYERAIPIENQEETFATQIILTA